MEINEFVDSLNLPFEGELKGKEYVINVDNSDDFSTLFNTIDLNKNLHLTGESKATEKESLFRFTDGYFEVVLEANYDTDVYKLTVTGV